VKPFEDLHTELTEELMILACAVHEAAHEAVAKHYGVEVERVVVVKPGMFTDLHGWVTIEPWRPEEDDEADGSISAAGMIATERFLVEQGVNPAEAKRWSDSGAEEDDQRMSQQSELRDVSRATFDSNAERIIDSNWEEIQSRGEELVRLRIEDVRAGVT
jgi:hypothetical protein